MRRRSDPVCTGVRRSVNPFRARRVARKPRERPTVLQRCITIVIIISVAARTVVTCAIRLRTRRDCYCKAFSRYELINISARVVERMTLHSVRVVARDLRSAAARRLRVRVPRYRSYCVVRDGRPGNKVATRTHD